MSYTFTEQELKLVLREAPRSRHFWAALPWLTAVLVAGVALSFAFRPMPAQSVPLMVPSSVTATPAPPASTPEPASTPVPTPTPLPVTLSNNTVSVPDVAISAPILWEVGGSTKEMNTALAQGVIHVAGTPRPGQQGFTAIAGHSSNYPWVKGDFNAIFAPLTQTVLGQTIELNYNGTMYRYQITKRYEVAPNQTEILNQHDRTGLRLITCTPVGTALRRLIIEADQVFPDPLQAAPFQGSANTAELPSGS